MPLDHWDRVRRGSPCPKCHRADWCLVAKDGSAVLCQRTASGRFHARTGGYVHRLVETNRRVRAVDDTDWTAYAVAAMKRMTEGRRQWVDRHLGLPAGTTWRFAVGCDSDRFGDFLVLPMVNGRGQCVGVSRRYLTPDHAGVYRKLSKGHNGLFLGRQFGSGDVIYVVEGMTDVMAMAAMGVESAVGRPSNTGGVDELTELLAGDGRVIVVIGENDQLPTGEWPGLYGCLTVAQQLARRLRRPVLPRLTPGGLKDVREWARANQFDGGYWSGQMKLDEVNTL